MGIRCKFRVSSITHTLGTKYDPVTHKSSVVPQATIRLNVVGQGSEEDSKFYASTPSGQIDVGLINADAAAQFDIGSEFYVDFTPVPKA